LVLWGKKKPFCQGHYGWVEQKAIKRGGPRGGYDEGELRLSRVRNDDGLKGQRKNVWRKNDVLIE